MTNITRSFIALTTAATIALAAPAASAGGSISFTFNASNADEANAIRTGLVLYQVANDIQANGHISQNGMNNIAGLVQGGSGNVGIIHQEGDNHHGTLGQYGNDNSCGLFQFGEGTHADVEQHGDGEACIVIQAGF